MTAKIGIATAFFQHHKAGTWFYTVNLLRCLDAMPGAAERFRTLDFLDRPVPGLNNIRHVTCPFPDHKLAKLFWPNIVLPRSAARQGLDVVHAPTHYGTFVPSRCRNVITVHDVTPILFPETHERMQVYYHRYVLPHVLRRADAIITISECSKRDIVRIYGVDEAKIHIVYNGVDGRFSPGYRRSSAFVDALPERYILNIGTLEARKNLPRLLEAYALARKQGLTHPLLIGGARGWRQSSLSQIVERLGLENAVQFLGFVEDEDLPALYARAECLIYPSLYEGFGLPVIEGMASGTPVVTSNCSSMAEVAADAALLVDPLDVADIAEKLLHVAGSAELRDTLREKGLRRAADFSWEKMARETMAVYERTA
jgi:glycosyltransferase involved in cell wall biosynthesis